MEKGSERTPGEKNEMDNERRRDWIVGSATEHAKHSTRGFGNNRRGQHKPETVLERLFFFNETPHIRDICKGYKKYRGKCITYRMTGKQTQDIGNVVTIAQKIQPVSENCAWFGLTSSGILSDGM